MTIIKSLLKELEQEASTTRKMLQLIPDDKYDWQPHPKSMSIRRLSAHIAELPTWITIAITTKELDFASSPYDPVVVNSTQEVLELFEISLENGRTHLENADPNTFDEAWVLRNGEEIYGTWTKAETIRQTYCQIVHHRAQLGVFLRLLDIPIPGSYGPSADEMEMAPQETHG